MTLGRNNETVLGYCNEVDVENFLLLDIDDTFSPQLNSWIAAAEAQVNRYLGYTTASGILLETIVDEKTSVRVSSTGDLMVFPRKYPISSIQNLSITKGSTDMILELEDEGIPKYDIPTSADYIQFSNNDLTVTGGSVLTSFSSIRWSNAFVKLSYVAGYATVPADIRQATVNLVSDVVMRHTNKEGLASITQGRVSKRWEARDGKSDFYLDAFELLKPYRLASRWI
jgi:hypothetical protein